MASVINRPNKHRWVQFYDGEGKRQTIRLGQVTKKNADEVCRRVEALLAARVSGDSLDASTAAWVRNLEGKIRDRLVKLGLAEPKAQRMLLGEFIDDFIANKKEVKASTIDTFKKGRDCLVAHFGEDRRLETITKSDAKRWRVWLATSGNRRDKNRKSMADNTVRRRTGKAKQFFDDAVLRGLIESNPFSDLPSTVRENAKRQFFVERSVADDCISAAPDARWRAIIALARYGGLRCPSELSTLTWDMVDFAAGRLNILAPKKEHLPCGGRRVCPLFPELRPYLEDLYDLAEPGETQVIAAVTTASNLRTTMKKIIGRAGHEQWPKLFQNLRASRETELLAIYPAKDVTGWIGNGIAVAMKHYAMARAETFEAAAATPSGPMPECKGEAKSEAIAKRNPKPQASASNGAEPQRHKKSPEKPGQLQVAATSGGSPQGGEMGDEGLEPPTFSV